MARSYFGTDGIRGVVGQDLTPEIVERLGRAATIWAGGGSVLLGRDTRGSGPELEQALARGIVSVGGCAVLAGVLPTPAVALFARDLGAVVSASHNPPEYNGVKLFDRDGAKLTDAVEEEIEALFDEVHWGGGGIEHDDGVSSRYVERVLERFGSDLSGLRIGVDCANGAYAKIAPKAFQRLGAEVTEIGTEPDGANINVGCGATYLRTLQRTVARSGLDLGVAFDGDGDRMLAVDGDGCAVDGDEIVDPRASPWRRRRRRDDDDEPRVPRADGGARRSRGHDRRRRSVRPRGAWPRGRQARGRAVGSHHLARRARHRRRPRRCAPPLPRTRGPPAGAGGGDDAAVPAGYGERTRSHQGSAAEHHKRGRRAESEARSERARGRSSLRD